MKTLTEQFAPKRATREVVYFLANIIPQPYRLRAMQNTGSDDAIKQVSTAREALAAAFEWSNSPEGEEYWRKCYNEIEVR